MKLATELSRRGTGRTLYILDEPTTGLHMDDVRKLLGVLQRLVDAGNTVLVIEHNLDVIKSVDWIIDLGPEGGEGGGRVVAEGFPEQVARTPGSWTGVYLRPLLEAAGTLPASADGLETGFDGEAMRWQAAEGDGRTAAYRVEPAAGPLAAEPSEAAAPKAQAARRRAPRRRMARTAG